MLRILGGRHENVSFVKKVRHTHPKLQRKGFREAARRSRQRRLVVHGMPAICQRPRELLRLEGLRSSGTKALRDRATGGIPEHVGSANKLPEHGSHGPSQASAAVAAYGCSKAPAIKSTRTSRRVDSAAPWASRTRNVAKKSAAISS